MYQLLQKYQIDINIYLCSQINLMKKIILLSIVVLGNFMAVNAQSNNTGSINVRVGGNVNLAATLTTTKYGNISSDEDTSAVLASTIPISVDFGIHKLVSVSLGFRSGKWLNEDPNDTNIQVKEAKTKTFNIGFKFYPISKKNFNLYLGYDFALSGFRKEKTTINTNTTDIQQWNGTGNFFNLGTNFYFGKGFGMYYQMGYTGYDLNLKEFTSTTGPLSINYIDNFNFSANSLVKGFQVELGFCYKFGNSEN